MLIIFSNIQDKYKLTLNADAIHQFASAAGQFGLTKTIFNQTQYDTLRRLRAYWVPRYLIHKERAGELQYVFPLLFGYNGEISQTLVCRVNDTV